MTLGATNREMRDLTIRLAALEGNARRSFVRLLMWSCASAVVSSALIYFVFR